MIEVPTDPIAWAQQYGLIVMDYNCPKCKGAFKTTKPIITRDCVGLATPEHPCGPGYVAAVLTPRTPELKDLWSQVLA